LWQHTVSRRRQRRPSLAHTRLAAALRRPTVWRRRAHVLRHELTLVWRPAAVHASRRRSFACRMSSVAAAGLTRDPPIRRHPVAARRQRRLSLPAAPMAVPLWGSTSRRRLRVAAGLARVPISRWRPVIALRRRRPSLPPTPVAAGLMWVLISRRRPAVARQRRRSSLPPAPVAAGLLWLATSRRRPVSAR